jgi:pentatricopeptide repeat domain-containing protein 1
VLQILGVLKEATGAGIRPDVNTLAAAIRTFGEEQQLQHAFDAIQLAGAEPGLQLRTVLISACGKSGQWQEAVRIFNELPAAGMTPNVHSLTAVMEACNTGQQQELTLSLLKQMRQQGLQPTAPVYTAAINACASTLPAAQWELALALLNEMQHSSSATPSAHAYSCALRACSRASQWQHALDILSDMQSAGVSPTPRCLAYATVACVQS